MAPAESLAGLRAKARVLLTKPVADMGGQPFDKIALSLARDLLEADERILELRPHY